MSQEPRDQPVKRGEPSPSAQYAVRRSRVVLLLDPQSNPITGLVEDDAGTKAFTGWLQLAAGIEQVRASRAGHIDTDLGRSSGSRTSFDSRTSLGQNTEILKEGWEAFGRGDFDAVKATWHDDIEWENPHWEKGVAPGVTRGKDAILRIFDKVLGDYEVIDLGPDEYIEQGDTVVILAHFKGRAKATGRSVELPYVYVWRMRDGKASRCQFLTDTGLAAEATGTT